MLALVGIRSNVMCIGYNKSIMAELCSRCPVEQKHGRAVCVSGQTRPCVCVCVCVHSLQHWLLQHCGSPLFISAGLCD